jgi:hypothetical protein
MQGQAQAQGAAQVTSYSTTMHGPSSAAREQTNEYARCQVCGVQWQIKDTKRSDAQACAFCGAGAEAITVISEAPQFGEAKVY